MMTILEEIETGWEVYRNTLYYRHNFPVNLKFFQNQKFILKKLLLIHWGVLSLTYQLAKIKKFKSNLLTRIWGNKLSHTLLVDIQTGIILKEGNLITSVIGPLWNSLYSKLFTEALSVITKDWKQSKFPSIGKWIINWHIPNTKDYLCSSKKAWGHTLHADTGQFLDYTLTHTRTHTQNMLKSTYSVLIFL